MKSLKRILSLALALCLVLSIVPVSAIAAETKTSESESEDTFYRILHLDCGRKYFTKDWIIALINEMAAAGYNQLQLAFGNDGLRFLLDDMTFTANGTTYSHDTVVSKVEAGNEAQNSSGDKRWLTQSEMDEIIAHAKKKGIEIVPLLNLPGHANTVLDIADDTYNASGSNNTLNVVGSDAAVNFGYAIFQKYVDYFAGKGCKFFNFGADEYANDASGTFSFGRLDSTEYKSFVTFINKLASYIKEKGMTPRSFNDGLYYNNQTSVSIDTSIQCCYWSSGWGTSVQSGGYMVSSASTISGKGHAMINTHGDYYYVLGKDDKFDSDYSYASNFSNTAFMSSTISSPAGSMFCIWCDSPNAETETKVAEKTRLVLRAMAARMQGKSVDSISTDVINGGFNEDGTVNVTVEVGQSHTIDLEDYTGDAGALTTGDKYIAEAVVTVTEKKAESTVSTSKATSVADGKSYILIVHNEQYPNYALTSNTGRTDWGTKTLAFEQYTAAEDDNVWTLEASGNGYKLKSKAGYLNLGSSNNTGYVSSTGEVFTLEYSSNGWTVKNASNIYINALGGVNYYQSAGGYTDGSTTLDLYEVTEATEASTKLTVTGTGEGNTSVTVGSTTYNIVVTAPNKTGSYSLAKGNTLTLPEGATDVKIDGSVVTLKDGQLVAGNENGTATVTFTTVNAGNKVTARYTYTITVTVTDIDLSQVANLKIEYWITNAQTKDSDGNLSYTIKASDSGVYSENGVDVSTILPKQTIVDSRNVDYWRCRLLDKSKSNSSASKTEEQTTTGWDDDTFNGVGFTKVRYFNNKWSVFTENNEWVEVVNDHQLVAYYLEELPITPELKVNAADWGKKGDGSVDGPWIVSDTYCSFSVQIIYEDGSKNPVTTTAKDLAVATMFYGFKSGGRGIGTIFLNGQKDFQIWKIEASTGTVTATEGTETGPITANGFVWQDNAEIIFEDPDNPVDNYVIHNDAYSHNSTGYYENLKWNKAKEAILLTVYVKAKQTENSLQVVYKDEKFNDVLYSYYISVLDKTFDNGILNSDKNEVDWENDIPIFKGNEKRKDVTGYGIKNSLNVVQYFETDLTKVPEAQGKYKSELYTYTGSEINEDGTILYLYYNLNEEALSAKYVIDFGLPLTINVKQLLGSTESANIVSVVTSAQYGTLTYNNDEMTVTYQPGKILPTMDAASVTITYSTSTGTTTVLYNIGIYPASTVYYEEGFINWGDGWTGGSKGDKNKEQKTEALGSSGNYGYDDAYKSKTGASNGTDASTSVMGANGTFTFTGTGFDLYANCNESSGTLAVMVRNKDGVRVKGYLVDTVIRAGTSDATNQQKGSLYSLPIVALHDLPYGEYTVTLTKVYDDGNDVRIDGVRIYGTVQDSSIYAGDQEQEPKFEELRDHVLNAIGVKDSDQYGSLENIVDQVYNSTVGKSALILDEKVDYANSNTAQDLLDNGPKNELYLYKGQILTFKVKTSGVLQLGLKAPQDATNVKITVNGTENLSDISSSVDMFYKLADMAESETEYLVTVRNTGDKILSVTQLKVSGTIKTSGNEAGINLASLSFEPLTEEDIQSALLAMGYSTDNGNTTEPEAPVIPEEPEIVYADAIVNIDLVDYTGKSLASVQLMYNGVSGEKVTFSAKEILEKVAAQIPEKYALVDASAVLDLEICYGETHNGSVQIGKVTTLTINYVNIFGRKTGSVTLTKIQTAAGLCKFTASEIKAGASGKRKVLWLTNLYVPYGSDRSITVVAY